MSNSTGDGGSFGGPEAAQKWMDDFAHWLSSRWTTERFSHSYIDRRSALTNKHSPASRWSVNNLSEARDNYIWNSKTLDQNTTEISRLRNTLLWAIDSNNDDGALSASLAILKWGNVASRTKGGERPSVRWLTIAARDNLLCSKIRDAVSSLSKSRIERFDGTDLAMDSGLTKVISFADRDNKLIIYDGRVGAALGYLCRLFLVESGYAVMPDCLRFCWGGARNKDVNRNPGTEHFRFPELGRGKSRHKVHAQMMVTASNLIDRICQYPTHTATSREWEAALFMVGYEVPRHAAKQADEIVSNDLMMRYGMPTAAQVFDSETPVITPIVDAPVEDRKDHPQNSEENGDISVLKIQEVSDEGIETLIQRYRERALTTGGKFSLSQLLLEKMRRTKSDFDGFSVVEAIIELVQNSDGCLISYGQLYQKLAPGKKWSGNATQALMGRALDKGIYYCIINGLPILTVLVVRANDTLSDLAVKNIYSECRELGLDVGHDPQAFIDKQIALSKEFIRRRDKP